MVQNELLRSATGEDLMVFYENSVGSGFTEEKSGEIQAFHEPRFFAFGSGDHQLKITSVDIKTITPYCHPGMFLETDQNSGKEKCSLCAAGTYQPDGGGKESCFITTPGFYQDEEGTVSPKLCADGTYTDSFEASSCKECPFNRASDGTSRSQDRIDLLSACPYDCKKGTFSEDGWFSVGSVASHEVECNGYCQKGYFNVLNTTDCFPCGNNKYSDASRVDAFIDRRPQT